MRRLISELGIAGVSSALMIAAPLSGATAADLPVKVAGVQYMKSCTAEGEGFFYIPGSDTCLRLGGYAWAEGYYNTYSHYPSENDKTYTVATAGFILDARTNTEFGTLRSYIEARFAYRSSDPFSEGVTHSEVDLWNAYIQFAGFTAGKAQSFFDFYANANVLGTDPSTIGDDVRLNLLAYTFEFAKGWSATVSLEDAGARLNGVLSNAAYLDVVYEDYTAGINAPDVVGNVKYEGKWGQAQVSGALHQVHALNSTNNSEDESTWGYALQAGIMFNLPTLGEGDTFYLQSAYAQGATSYLGLQDPSGGYAAPDAFVGANGLSLVTGWNVTASLLHNWNAKWSTALFGGYAAYDYNDDMAVAYYGASGGTNYNVGGYVAFTPVSNLQLALQYDYTVNEASDYVPSEFGAAYATTKANRVLLMAARTF